MRRKLAAGNWKMNGTSAALSEIENLAARYQSPGCDILICPPATLIAPAVAASSDGVMIGGQDCHANISGAHTGDISGAMIKDAGANHVILGHSERRVDHGEGSVDVNAKARAARDANLIAIICIGESLEERDAQRTLDVIGAQMDNSIPDGATGTNTVLAYEPIWAIGTGKVPTLEQIGEVHDFMRQRLQGRFGETIGASVRLLYGGSVKPSNATDIFAVPDVDGALVGGASLKADDFGGIIDALQSA